MLSGKNERRFLRWFFTPEADTKISYSEFIKLPPEMQKGVYEKYFKSEDYYIEINLEIDLKTSEFDGYDWSILKINKDLTVTKLYSGWNEFELEAFTEAVKQLDKLINKKL
jgi:hypothetical protein